MNVAAKVIHRTKMNSIYNTSYGINMVYFRNAKLEKPTVVLDCCPQKQMLRPEADSGLVGLSGDSWTTSKGEGKTREGRLCVKPATIAETNQAV